MKVQFVLAVTILSILSILSCRKDSDITTTEEYTLSGVNGFITNEENNAVSQAEVIINGTKFMTDEFGYFNAEQVAHIGKIVINVNKSGYFDGSRTIFTRSNEKSFVKVSLIEETLPYKLNSLVGGTILIEDIVKLEFPPNAIVDKNGNNYDGIVLIGIKYLDPSLSTTFDEMPGALIGQNQNLEDVALESYGMAGFWLRDLNGNSLNIKNGEKCKMTLKIPEKMVSYAPNIMPLWHFDESKGIWIEEGAASRNGNYYEGEVSHFSFWNCDYSRPLVYIKGTLILNGGTKTEGKVGISIEGQNAQRISHTNELGEFEGLVPANELLRLEVFNYCNERLYSKNIGPFSADQDLGNVVIDNKNKDIKISGQVLGCNGSPAPNAIISLFEGDNRSDYTADLNGRFNITKQNCNASTIRIKAISIQDEKESKMILLESSINNTDLIIIACDNNVDEYIRITFSNGEKFNIFNDILGAAGEGIFSNFNFGIERFEIFFNKKAIVNTPVNTKLIFVTGNTKFSNTFNSGTTTYSTIVSDNRDKKNYNEGIFQLSNITKFRVQSGVEVPLETGLTATGTFRYKND